MDPELMGEGMYKILEEIIKDPEGFADRIKVSIIMPVYNAEDFLVECLDSILIWDEINVECIWALTTVPADRSLEILNEYGQGPQGQSHLPGERRCRRSTQQRHAVCYG